MFTSEMFALPAGAGLRRGVRREVPARGTEPASARPGVRELAVIMLLSA